VASQRQKSGWLAVWATSPQVFEQPVDKFPIDASQAPDTGWYADPHDPLLLRWWDGTGWTDATRASAPASAVPVPSTTVTLTAAPSTRTVARKRRPSPRNIVLLLLGIVVASVVVFVLYATSGMVEQPCLACTQKTNIRTVEDEIEQCAMNLGSTNYIVGSTHCDGRYISRHGSNAPDANGAPTAAELLRDGTVSIDDLTVNSYAISGVVTTKDHGVATFSVHHDPDGRVRKTCQPHNEFLCPDGIW
jgi:hypothetical protein